MSMMIAHQKRWSVVVLLLLLLMMVQGQVQQQTQDNDEPPFDYCNVMDYYSAFVDSDPTSWTKEELVELITDTHRNIVSYENIYKALIDLDGDNNSTVNLIYSNTTMSLRPGQFESWTREHLFPDSRGAIGNYAFTDVYNLRPASRLVTYQRQDKLFGACLFQGVTCITPAFPNGPNDTSQDNQLWMPPTIVRGDIARALFYMELRYHDTTLALKLTDCPPFERGQMGMLSQLLEWHKADPVSQLELERNQKACERWQGNRNPFVDYPELVEPFFGLPDTLVAGTTMYSQCLNNNIPGIVLGTITTTTTSAPAPAPTPAPTPSPTIAVTRLPTPSTTAAIPPPPPPPPPPTTTPPPTAPQHINACDKLQPGDVFIFVVETGNSQEEEDGIGFLALEDLPEGLELHLTDNAWTGDSFTNREGVLKLEVSAPGIQAGEQFGYGNKYGSDNQQWLPLQQSSASGGSGSFKLEASGDSIFLYCYLGNGSIQHLVGFSNANHWVQPVVGTLNNGEEEEYYGLEQSALPDDLWDVGSIVLPHMNNYVYQGPSQGEKEDLQHYMMDADNWEGSDTSLAEILLLEEGATTSIVNANAKVDTSNETDETSTENDNALPLAEADEQMTNNKEDNLSQQSSSSNTANTAASLLTSDPTNNEDTTTTTSSTNMDDPIVMPEAASAAKPVIWSEWKPIIGFVLQQQLLLVLLSSTAML